jgi:hypothetical protein
MRKGMETNEFLGFIIAVIGVVLLGFFGVKLYNFFVDADMKNAQAFTDDLSGKIETLQDGQNNTFLLRSVKGWVLVGWNKDIPIAKKGEIIGKDRKPQKCFDNSCLCLCEAKIANCQQVGYCRVIDRNISVLSTGTLNYSVSGFTAYSGPFSYSYDYSKFYAKCLFFKENKLVPILSLKDENSIKIEYDYELFNSGGDYQKLYSSLSSCDFIPPKTKP